jgi:DNA repair exonuclease SbcCD ATPase subunit
MRRLITLTLALALAVPLLAQAQADNKANREREALRRAQAELRTLREALAKLQAEQAGERHAAQQAATAATQAAQDSARRDQAQRAQIEQLRSESDERRQANATLSQLLTQRSKALADAQRRVGELHATGVEALTLYRDKDRLTGALQDDPVLGLTGVRVENRVQALRQRLDSLQQPAPAPD